MTAQPDANAKTPPHGCGPHDDGRARRNVYLLSACQALAGSNATVNATLGGVIGIYLASDKTYATLPVTTMVAGAAIATLPASMFMRVVGRRAGFMTGAAIGACGAALVAFSLIQASFLLACIGTMLMGMFNAFSQYFRFAAADTASVAFRPKAISLVLAGGVAAAILGPQIVIYGRDLFAPVQFAGAYAGLVVVCILAFCILAFIDIPMPRDEVYDQPPRPLGEILANRTVIIAILCAMVSFAMMSFVMTATPLAMLACNHDVNDAANIIQWHAIAMFAPSFFTGHLISRYGAPVMIAAGFTLMIGCGVAALSGIEIQHFWLSLVALGLGWNFSFVSATALLASCYRASERNKVQGINDFAVFGSVALASLSSGALFQIYGWSTVQWVMMALSGLALGLVAVWQWRRRSLATA